MKSPNNPSISYSFHAGSLNHLTNPRISYSYRVAWFNHLRKIPRVLPVATPTRAILGPATPTELPPAPSADISAERLGYSAPPLCFS